MQALEDTLHKPTEEELLQKTERENAAIHIQRAWRKRQRKRYLGSDFLWKDLATHARMQVRHQCYHARSGTVTCQLLILIRDPGRQGCRGLRQERPPTTLATKHLSCCAPPRWGRHAYPGGREHASGRRKETPGDATLARAH